MSYTNLEPAEVQDLNQSKKKQFEKLRVCGLVKTLINSQGWQEIVLPSLNRMIVDEVGGKLGDNWTYGKIQTSKETDKIWFHIGRKQALLEFHNHVYNHLKAIKVIENNLKELNEELKGEFEQPMMEIKRGVQETQTKTTTTKRKKKKAQKKKSKRG